MKPCQKVEREEWSCTLVGCRLGALAMGEAHHVATNPSQVIHLEVKSPAQPKERWKCGSPQVCPALPCPACPLRSKSGRIGGEDREEQGACCV